MRAFLMLAGAAALAGCSASNDSGTSTSETVQPAAAPAAKDGAEPLKVSIPQLAYTYQLGFLVPGAKIVEVQDAHRALCERMGPARCQLLALERGDGDDAHANAHLKLRVATAEARAFTDAATTAVGQAGGRATDSNIATEDVSKNIVDTEARVRQRELLVARLTDVLRKRTGTVAELVAAERSVAQAQEELDQGRAWLAELRGRVAMSDLDIRYEAIAATAGSASGRIGEALADSGTGFVLGVQWLAVLAIYLAPWLLLLGLPIWWLARRGRRASAATPQA